jgi:hypothetical protein
MHPPEFVGIAFDAFAVDLGPSNRAGVCVRAPSMLGHAFEPAAGPQHLVKLFASSMKGLHS